MTFATTLSTSTNSNLRLKMLRFLNESLRTHVDGAVSLTEIQNAVCKTSLERLEVDRILVRELPSYIATHAVRLDDGFDTHYFLTTEGVSVFAALEAEHIEANRPKWLKAIFNLLPKLK